MVSCDARNQVGFGTMRSRKVGCSEMEVRKKSVGGGGGKGRRVEGGNGDFKAGEEDGKAPNEDGTDWEFAWRKWKFVVKVNG